jgi:hypothetical protein
MPYRTAGGTLRYVSVSGYPDSWLDRAGGGALDFQITAVGQTALGPWYDWLRTGTVSLQIRERLRTGVNAPGVVKNITEHTDGRYKITTDVPHGLKSGDKVVLTKLKGVNLANATGTRKVADVVDPTNFTIDRGGRSDLADVSLTVEGVWAKVGYTYEPALFSPEPYVPSTRRRGRPFAQRRGRRSAAK